VRVAIYCRVSRDNQTLDQQRVRCVELCEREGWPYEIFEEKVSGAKTSRRELDLLMQSVRSRKFEAVMVWKLDRLGRSLKHLIQIIEEFDKKQVQFICLSPSIDTKTASGRFFLQIMGAVAELERELIRERVKFKLDLLKANGQRLGRPKGSRDRKPRKRLGYFQRYAK